MTAPEQPARGFPPLVRLRGWFAGLHPRHTHYGWFALTLAVGVAGAGLFLLGRLPLPWMLGPMSAAMVLTLAGVPLTIPPPLRSAMLVVLGVMVGATASPDLISHALGWTLPLLGLLVVMAAGTSISFLYFRRLAGYDAPTSYFASVPGGLTEMILLSEHKGGDHRRVALTHAVRVSIVVLLVPFLVQLVTGVNFGARTTAGVPLMDLPGSDLLWFIGTYAAGAILASFMSSAMALFLGPLLISTLLHGSGMTGFAIPMEAAILAQLIVGLSLGVRFYGMQLRTVGGSFLWAIGSCFILIGVSFGAAMLAERLTGESFVALVLAYSPGGVAEMSLVAVALQIEVAFVVLHHLFRLLVVSLGAPFAYEATVGRGPPA